MTRSDLGWLVLLVAAFVGTARVLFLVITRWGFPWFPWPRRTADRVMARHARPKGGGK